MKATLREFGGPIDPTGQRARVADSDSMSKEMADEFGITLHEFLRLLEEVRGTVLLSLDQSMQVDDDHDLAGLADVIEDKSAVNKLEELEDDESRQKLLNAGWQAVGTAPEGLANRMQADLAQLSGIIAARGIKTES